MNQKTQEIIVNNKKFILRPAEDCDEQFILNLLKENMLESFTRHWGEWNEKSFNENYHKENIRIIDYENTSIGYIDFKFKSDCGYINNIQLCSSFTGKGIGTYIMKLLEKETHTHKLTKIRLKVFKDNLAVKLYEKLSYQPISEDVSSFIMEKDLV